ncbi:hypothetical protein CPB86DRAFT_357154 [Serendipita vermifera]|nr:hypothetical protein CPB86DRAFT_357154 [Serendipita vermifera]
MYEMSQYYSEAPFYPGVDSFDVQSGAIPFPQVGHGLAQVIYPQDEYDADNSFESVVVGMHSLAFAGTVDPRDLSLSPSTPATLGVDLSLTSSSPIVPTGALGPESIGHKRQTRARRNLHPKDLASQRRITRNREVYIPCPEVIDLIKRVREILDYDRVTGQVRTLPLKQQTTLFKPFIQLDGPSVRERTHKCLICRDNIKNGTQMIQHVMDHFRHFPFHCNKPGWYVSRAPTV